MEVLFCPYLQKYILRDSFSSLNITSYLGDKVVVGYLAYSQCVGLSRLGIRKHQV